MRVPSGIPGLDILIEGGFPERTVNIISGPAGSAKTLFGMQYIYNGAKNYSESGLFIALEESRENIERAMKSYGMDLSDAHRTGKMQLFDFGEMRKDYIEGKGQEGWMIDFRALEDFLKTQIDRSNAKRLVIDSISAINLSYSSSEKLRREFFRFCRFLKEKNVTAILIAETPETNLMRFDIEGFVSDSLIVLGYENVGGEYRRTITIYKMRFTKHDPYKHPFLIMKNGIEVSAEEALL